jgi:hypothetical protein
MVLMAVAAALASVGKVIMGVRDIGIVPLGANLYALLVGVGLGSALGDCFGVAKVAHSFLQWLVVTTYLVQLEIFPNGEWAGFAFPCPLA